MKVLQVNVVYNSGSTGRIVCDIHGELRKQGIDSVVCYGRGANVREPHIHKICGEWYSHVNHFIANCTGVLYGGCLLSTHRLISRIRKEKPDVVHLHCLNGFFINIYRLLDWLKKNHIKTVLTLHAEFMYTGGCGHSLDCLQWKSCGGCGSSPCPRYRSDMKVWLFDRSRSMWERMKRSFSGFDKGLVITSVSPWLMQRAAVSSILKGKCHRVVLNGIDTSVFYPRNKNIRQQLRKELRIKHQHVVFHATANFSNEHGHIKGGEYIAELASRLPDVQFVVAGPARAGMTLPKNILLMGQITDRETLAQLYSMADLTVITSRKETFSMIVAESLCCGTPVVGFKAGAPEMIALKEYSAFPEFGDMDSLEYHVRKFAELEFDVAHLSKLASSLYSRETMVREYSAIYTSLIHNAPNE